MDTKKNITPHLWFDKEAKEAAEFYCTVFENSRVTSATTLPGTPSGDTDVVAFELRGMPFMAISAGPYFKLNPAISFIVNFDPSREADAASSIDAAWNKLAEGGQILMPLQEYPFSKRYGWVQDRYGVSWQLILTNPEGDERPGIVPSLLFVGEKCGKAEEAINFYLSVFKDSKPGSVMKYPAGSEPDQEGTIMFADFKLLGTWLAAMDSAHKHDFDFNEAVSLMVLCADQAEIDYYWEKLSAVPESEQCGWLKDKYGVSWQIVPERMEEMLRTGTPDQVKRLTEAFMPMKKLDMAALDQAYQG